MIIKVYSYSYWWFCTWVDALRPRQHCFSHGGSFFLGWTRNKRWGWSVHKKDHRLGTVSRPFQGGASFVNPFCYVLRLSLFYFLVSSLQPCDHLLGRDDILTLLFVMCPCAFVTFLYDVSGQVWYLNVSIPDLCLLLWLKVAVVFPRTSI